MVLKDRNFYIVKQSDGLMWNFTYDDNIGIIYRVLKDNEDSFYDLLVGECRRNFSVLLFQNDDIYILYEDLCGNILMCTYDGIEWSEGIIVVENNSDMYEVEFNAVLSNDEIYLFYSILDKNSEMRTFFYQVIDSKLNFFKPNIIDIIDFDYANPFNIYTLQSNNIIIMYQKLNECHELGYKVYNYEDSMLSKFYVIDRSIQPFEDYSLLFIEDTLHAIYIKNTDGENKAIYSYGSTTNFKNSEVFEGMNIISCSFFIAEGNIWIIGITNNNIYFSLSTNNGKNFSSPPYEEALVSLSIIKAIYMSNQQNRCNLIIDEIYIQDGYNSPYTMIPDIYKIFTEINGNETNNVNKYLSYIKNFINENRKVILKYEEVLNAKEKLINKISYKLSEKEHQLEVQKTNCKNYEIKLADINKQYIQFKNGKNELNENIDFMQQNLISKEEKINELENINLQDQSQIINCKEQMADKNNIIKTREQQIESLQNKISTYREEIGKLKSGIEALSLQDNYSFFKRMLKGK